MIKLLLYILFEKYIYSLALKMACPGNQDCVNCISALSFPITFTLTAASGRHVLPLANNVEYIDN